MFYIGYRCYSQCPTEQPFVAGAGSRVCIETCSSGIYFKNGSILQCNNSCSLPFGIQNYGAGSPVAYECSLCSNFVLRSSSLCTSSCSYRNFTIVNSTSITVCEDQSDSTNCRWIQNSSTFYTCHSTCVTFYIVPECFTLCPSENPLVL